MQRHNRTDSNQDAFTDTVLLSLAKCLDVSAYANRIADDQITKRRSPKDRIKLILNGWLLQCRQAGRGLSVQAERLLVWIFEVSAFREIEANPTRFLSPYLDCNQPLESTTDESVQGKVSVNFFQTWARFKHCPSCDKLYWSGTPLLEYLRAPQGVAIMCPFG